MKTYLIHHRPRSREQDTWAVSFSLPYIASQYARAGDGIWYVKTWLTAEQIKKRLAILFDDQDELLIQDFGRDGVSMNASIAWLDGRLEDEEPVTLSLSAGPRAAFAAVQALVHDLTRPFAGTLSRSATASM